MAPGGSSHTAPKHPSERLDVCRGCSPPLSGNTTVCSASQGAGYLVRFVRAFNRLLIRVPLKYLRQHLPKVPSASRWAQANYLHLPEGQLAPSSTVLTSHTAASMGTSESACLKALADTNRALPASLPSSVPCCAQMWG